MTALRFQTGGRHQTSRPPWGEPQWISSWLKAMFNNEHVLFVPNFKEAAECREDPKTSRRFVHLVPLTVSRVTQFKTSISFQPVLLKQNLLFKIVF